MSVNTAARMAHRKRRITTLVWIIGLTILTGSLIYWEQTAILYILSTVGVTFLLVVVAKADLAHADTMTDQGANPLRSSAGDTARR